MYMYNFTYMYMYMHMHKDYLVIPHSRHREFYMKR